MLQKINPYNNNICGNYPLKRQQIQFRGDYKYSDTFIAPDSFMRSANGVNEMPEIEQPKKPLFHKKLKRGQFLTDGKVFNGNTTYMFRDDLDWKMFGDFLTERFNKCDKVNVYNYAASKGYEPYSLSILLQLRLGENAKKFFPIMAKDIDREIIAEDILKQKTGNIKLKITYCDCIQRQLKINKEELSPYMEQESKYYGNAKLYKKALEPVKFSCANILEDVENIDTEHPSLVMCRNMWPYVDKNEYQDFAKRLYDRLAAGSVVVVGYFDYVPDECFPPKLLEAGFKPLDKNDRENLIFLKD